MGCGGYPSSAHYCICRRTDKVSNITVYYFSCRPVVDSIVRVQCCSLKMVAVECFPTVRYCGCVDTFLLTVTVI